MQKYNYRIIDFSSSNGRMVDEQNNKLRVYTYIHTHSFILQKEASLYGEVIQMH